MYVICAACVIREYLCLEGTSRGHLVQSPGQSALETAQSPVGSHFETFSRKEIPQQASNHCLYLTTLDVRCDTSTVWVKWRGIINLH